MAYIPYLSHTGDSVSVRLNVQTFVASLQYKILKSSNFTVFWVTLGEVNQFLMLCNVKTAQNSP